MPVKRDKESFWGNLSSSLGSVTGKLKLVIMIASLFLGGLKLCNHYQVKDRPVVKRETAEMERRLLNELTDYKGHLQGEYEELEGASKEELTAEQLERREFLEEELKRIDSLLDLSNDSADLRYERLMKSIDLLLEENSLYLDSEREE